MAAFKAIVIEKAEGGTKAALADFDEANLMDGDVTVRVEYSTINYKDGLAVTGKAPVVRRFPMIAGIDFAGTVESSTHAAWKAGDTNRLYALHTKEMKEAPTVWWRLLDRRNARWIPRIETAIRSGRPTLIVAGAPAFRLRRTSTLESSKIRENC